MLVFEIFILSYLGFVVFHNLFFSLISFTYSEKKFYRNNTDEYLKIAVLLPAYREDAVILSSARHAVTHDYPADKFTIMVIADSLQDETVHRLRATGAEVLVVDFEQSTKVKSLQAALRKLDGYDIAVILDADNVMKKGFLSLINQAYKNGYTCIQGRRTAKNTNTQFAFLDGISESVNNRIFRRGYNAAGLSAALIGSGMAFPFTVLRDHINSMNSVGGFDRELNLRLLNERRKIHYLESAVVFDEKVERPEVFANQRKRWLSSQFVYLRRFFAKGCRALVTGNFAFFESAVLNNLLLPRILTLGILPIVSLLFFLVRNYLHVWWGWPALFFLLYIVALMIAVPREYFNKRLFAAVTRLPQAFFIMFLTLFKLRNANKRFIHTPHSVVGPELNEDDSN